MLSSLGKLIIATVTMLPLATGDCCPTLPDCVVYTCAGASDCAGCGGWSNGGGAARACYRHCRVAVMKAHSWWHVSRSDSQHPHVSGVCILHPFWLKVAAFCVSMRSKSQTIVVQPKFAGMLFGDCTSSLGCFHRVALKPLTCTRALSLH